MANIETLYKNYGILADAKEEISKHANEYISIINAAAGDNSEKRLASQFIPQFSKFFPQLKNDALNVHLDLCEDADPIIRRQAIKALPGFCHDSPDVVVEITGLLTQMLFSDDPIEQDLVQISILNLFKDYPDGVIRGLFEKMLAVESIVRTRAMKFVANSLIKQIAVAKEKTNITSVLIEESLKIFKSEKLDKEQTELCVMILNSAPMLKDNQQRISATVDEILKSFTSFSFASAEQNQRIVAVLEAGKSFGNDCSSYVPLLTKIFTDIFPYMTSASATPEINETVLTILRKIVGACKIMKPEYIQNILTIFYGNLIAYLPEPPKDIAPENIADLFSQYCYDWNFLEPIFISFYVLYSKFPSFMGWNQKDNESVKQLREKLQFIVRIMQYEVSSKTAPVKAQPESDRPRIKAPIESAKPATALKKSEPVFSGAKLVVNTIIKSFFYNPPSTSCTFTPSWSKGIHVNVSDQSKVSSALGHKIITAPTGGVGKSKANIEPYVHPGARNPNAPRIIPPQMDKRTGPNTTGRGKGRFNRF